MIKVITQSSSPLGKTEEDPAAHHHPGKESPQHADIPSHCGTAPPRHSLQHLLSTEPIRYSCHSRLDFCLEALKSLIRRGRKQNTVSLERYRPQACIYGLTSVFATNQQQSFPLSNAHSTTIPGKSRNGKEYPSPAHYRSASARMRSHILQAQLPYAERPLPLPALHGSVPHPCLQTASGRAGLRLPGLHILRPG